MEEAAKFVGRPRRPRAWWSNYLDGRVYVFIEGVDFTPGRLEATRMSVLNYVNRLNGDMPLDGPTHMSVRTHKRLNDDGVLVLDVQAYYTNAV